MIGLTLDFYCETCDLDTTVTVTAALDNILLAETECCSTQVEMYRTDVIDLLADCGV